MLFEYETSSHATWGRRLSSDNPSPPSSLPPSFFPSPLHIHAGRVPWTVTPRGPSNPRRLRARMAGYCTPGGAKRRNRH